MPRCPKTDTGRTAGVATTAGTAAFTLVELMVACAILSVFMLVMMGIAGQGSKLWALTESQNQHRQRARAMLDFMASEMRQTVYPADSVRPGLQFVINPTSLSSGAHFNRDAVFWQAPIATDTTHGDLAEVGYFVRWSGTQASLCRYFVNPGDANYLIYNNPEAWITDTLLAEVTPADKASRYRGLFLENVVGLWVDARTSSGAAYAGNSRTALRLPAYAEVSLVLIDSSTARRLTAADVATIRTLNSTATTPAQFIQQLPAGLRSGCSYVSTVVNFSNYR
ncbi:MAG: PilW family protein [Candidatus Methylacidiphilales bacterium]|nr:prepilin-type N-terminal cleavage/methylation domain-containing protein [Candidatus Methylacidiphilales bacterium]